MSHKYFCRCTAGIEELVRADLERALRAKSVSVLPRTVLFQSDAPLAELVNYRGIDDLFFLAGTFNGCGHTRSFLEQLTHEIKRSQVTHLLAQARALQVEKSDQFTVTASFIGKRNYNRWELAERVAKGVSESFNFLDLRERSEEPTFHVRLHLHHDIGIVGVRADAKPLHKRSYKQLHLPGSLKPSVAYHLLSLARCRAGSVILDPCCGVGTVPLEAAVFGGNVTAIGCDISPTALDSAKKNCEALSLHLIEGQEIEARCNFLQGDVSQLPFASSSIDAVATDLPWGLQSAASGSGANNFLEASLAELSRVIKIGGRLVLLSKSSPEIAELCPTFKLQVKQEVPIRLYGQAPTISVLERIGGTNFQKARVPSNLKSITLNPRSA